MNTWMLVELWHQGTAWEVVQQAVEMAQGCVRGGRASGNQGVCPGPWRTNLCVQEWYAICGAPPTGSLSFLGLSRTQEGHSHR